MSEYSHFHGRCWGIVYICSSINRVKALVFFLLFFLFNFMLPLWGTNMLSGQIGR